MIGEVLFLQGIDGGTETPVTRRGQTFIYNIILIVFVIIGWRGGGKKQRVGARSGRVTRSESYVGKSGSDSNGRVIAMKRRGGGENVLVRGRRLYSCSKGEIESTETDGCKAAKRKEHCIVSK